MNFQTPTPAPTLAAVAGAMMAFWEQQADMAQQRNLWRPMVAKQLELNGVFNWESGLTQAVFMHLQNPRTRSSEELLAHLQKAEPTDYQFVDVQKTGEVLVAVVYKAGNYVIPVEDVDIVEIQSEMASRTIHIMGLAYALKGDMKYNYDEQQYTWSDCYFVGSKHGEIVRRSVYPDYGK
jgi:hypothetical protein